MIRIPSRCIFQVILKLPRISREALTVALTMVASMPSAALPVGGMVSAGSATIQSAASKTVVTQSSSSAIINWNSFNIGLGETVQFLQPDSHSVVLNRVLGPDPSTIYGSLSSNGQVFLINPEGILFGKGAVVNVASLVASTLNLTDRQFLEKSPQFVSEGRNSATVMNEGVIHTNADGGFVALLGANVRSDGTIVARLGTVALVAGAAMTLDMAGDALLNVKVDQGAFQAQVRNGGMILADGGQVLLSTQAAGELLQTAVNQTGVIQAQTIDNHQGVIRLLGDMHSGTVVVDGTLLAQGGSSGGDGGSVETSAARVIIAEGARIDTRATQGRTGRWLLDPKDFTIANVGGDISPATLVGNLLASNVTISSNDGLSGTGGDIHVNAEVHWAGATTLTLNAVHDVKINSPVTADTAGASLVIVAGHDVVTTAPITVVAAGTSVSITGGHDVSIGGALHAIAAGSRLQVQAGNDLYMAGAITATAANSTVALSAGRDAVVAAPVIAVAADSLIKIQAGHDLVTTTTAAIAASAATTQIELNAGHTIVVNSAIAAGAAGSGIKLISGVSGAGPGAASGTVVLLAAVASPNITIRFNPADYASTALEISRYPALSDARAWVYAQGATKVYDGTSGAALSFQGHPGDGGAVSLTPGIATFGDKQAGAGKMITFSDYQLGGVDANRFALFAGSGTAKADITPRPLNVVVNARNKVYDGTTADAVTLTDNRISGDQLTLAYGGANFSDKNVGNNKSVMVAGIQVKGVDALNYSANTTATAVANVTATSLTVTASNAEKKFGETPTLSAFTTLGLVNGETIGNVTETSNGTQASAGVTAGPYAIVPSNATGGTFSASNYLISYRNGALTVTPTPMLVTAASDIKFFGETADITAFTVRGLVNGDTVGSFTEFSPGAPASASVAGSPYPIKLSEASGGTFVASNYRITYVDGILTVLPQLPRAPGRIASSALAEPTKEVLPGWVLPDPPIYRPLELQFFLNSFEDDM
jgi:filamentous hemagglutinin family protein